MRLLEMALGTGAILCLIIGGMSEGIPRLIIPATILFFAGLGLAVRRWMNTPV